MPQLLNLSHSNILNAAAILSEKIKNDFEEEAPVFFLKIYAVPRGGIPCAYILMNFLPSNFTVELVDDIHDATIIIDDIEDSGETKKKLLEMKPDAKFYTFFKSNEDTWLSFPWERTLLGEDTGIEKELIRLSEYLKISVEDVKERLGVTG